MAVIVNRPPLLVTTVGLTLNEPGCEIWYGGRPPNTMTSAEMPDAQVFAATPWNVIVAGCALSGALLEGAMEKLARCVKPEERSVTCSSPVWDSASESTRTRMLATPDWSLVVVPETERISGAPGAEVMMRNSPDTTSNRTVRLASGRPDCESCTRTSASPPAQTDVPQAADWLALGVTVTTLLTVRGLTVSVALIGVAVPVSRTLSVTGVSTETGPGMTVSALPVRVPEMGTASWSLEVIR